MTELAAVLHALRPELHRFCARLMGSVIDGEDVVQDVLARAAAAPPPPDALRPWLFRVAHNRALDLLRGRAVRNALPLDDVREPPDPAPDLLDAMMQRNAVQMAVSRFAELPVSQRAVVVLKDFLDEPLADIAALLDLSVDAVKGHLARGRARLRAISACPIETSPPPISDAVARYVTLFNRHDWDALRALLAEDVRLKQSDYPLRSDNVQMFFGFYAQNPEVRVAPAWMDGREVIAVYERAASDKPTHIMWLDWRADRIRFIRDYRYVPYIMAEADLQM